MARRWRAPSVPFAIQQGRFAFDAPAVTGACAIAAHHSMTRNGDCQRIGGTGTSHSADGSGFSDLLRNLGVARGRAGRNLLQRFPDLSLERGAADIER
jgi:hypothetical protein